MQVEPLRQDGWIGLVEFSLARGVSLSTLRRYIKAHKIEYRVEHGKYLLKEDLELPPAQPRPSQSDVWGSLHREPQSTEGIEKIYPRIEHLEQELKQTREELLELKMLLAFYEDKFNSSSNGTA